jgi:hypothetical protein
VLYYASITPKWERIYPGSPSLPKCSVGCENKYYDKLHKNIYHTILTMNVDELIHKLKIIEII